MRRLLPFLVPCLLAALITSLLPGCGGSGIRRVRAPGRALTPTAARPQAERVSQQPQQAAATDTSQAAAAAGSPASPTPQPAAPAATQPTGSLDPAPAAASVSPPATPTPRHSLATVTVVNPSARFRADEPLSFGLPLARGQAQEPDQLRVWRPDEPGALALQARGLSRWPDGSLRWVLLDTALDLPARGQLTLSLGRADDIAAAADPWTLESLPGGGLVADDGSRRRTLWRAADHARGGDQVAGFAARLTDRFDHLYDGLVEPDTARILERGPRRLCFSIEGSHRSRDGAGLPIAFHRFRAVVHLIASPPPSNEPLGSDETSAPGLPPAPTRIETTPGLARVEWTLSNGPLEEPPGRLAFKAYELLAEVPEAPREIMVAGRALRNVGLIELTQEGAATRLVIDGKTQQSPPRGDLWMGVRGLDGDLFVQREESAHNHPAGMSCGADGALLVGLLPSLPGREYFLDDATRKTFRIDLVADAARAGPEWLERMAQPARIERDVAQVAATGAWGDAGHLYVPDPGSLLSRARPPADAPTGWADWGESQATNTHQSGSPRNRLSVFLEALQSGRDDIYRWDLARAWHAMDLRPYHIDGFLASQHPDANLYEGIPHSNEPPSRRLGRSEMSGRFPEYKLGLPDKGHGYNGFDPEHMTLDDVYECYLLTGSWQALDALRSAGEAMLTWKEVIPSGEIHSARTFGWTLRALVQVFRATGQDRYLDAARRLVARADAERGRGAVKYLRRMRADGRHLADQESESPFMVAVALHGLSAYWHETADPLVPPMAKDLSDFCIGAFRGTGFVADLPLDKPFKGGQADAPLGVSSWIPGALAAAAFITGDHSAVDRTRGYYLQLFNHSKQPVAFGGKDWHWWQPWLVSVSQRHGRDAVEHPER